MFSKKLTFSLAFLIGSISSNSLFAQGIDTNYHSSREAAQDISNYVCQKLTYNASDEFAYILIKDLTLEHIGKYTWDAAKNQIILDYSVRTRSYSFDIYGNSFEDAPGGMVLQANYSFDNLLYVTQALSQLKDIHCEVAANR